MLQLFRRCPRPPFDPLLFTLTCVVTLAGIPLLYSASYAEGLALHDDPQYFVLRQAAFALVGFAGLVAAAKVDLAWLRKRSRFFLGATVALLFVCLSHGALNGARRWISVGGFTVQPSEFAKLALIIYLASYLAKAREWIQEGWTPVVHVALVTGGVALLLLLQPHLSALLLVVGVATVMVVLAGLPWDRVLSLGCVLLIAGVPLFQIAPREQQNRVKVWLGLIQSEEDAYHQKQSLLAIERGGALGVGFCEGRQKLRYLPASHNDFIFSCIAEEFGFLGVVVVLSLFSALVIRCYDIAHMCGSQFGSLLCTGVATLLGLELVGHVGVATGLLPPTGVTLPLVSAGGSAFICVLFGIGLVLNVSRGVSPEVEAMDDGFGFDGRGDGRTHLPAPRPRRYGAVA